MRLLEKCSKLFCNQMNLNNCFLKIGVKTTVSNLYCKKDRSGSPTSGLLMQEMAVKTSYIKIYASL